MRRGFRPVLLAHDRLLGWRLFLLDLKTELSLWQGILISGGSLTIGWLAYDAMCKIKLTENPRYCFAAVCDLVVCLGV
jgi:uncharacterized membrane protein